jgi:hypothetical protein
MAMLGAGSLTSHEAPILHGGNQATSRCRGTLEATVYQGPSAGLTAAGELSLEIDPTGGLVGLLTVQDGPLLDVVGQANGRALHLVVELGGEQYLFGVGASQNDVSSCQDLAGGPLTGPSPGDSGGWTFTPSP